MEEKGVWRTVKGRRIFIEDGQSLTDAIKKSGKFKTNKNVDEAKKINKKDALEKNKKPDFRKQAEEKVRKTREFINKMSEEDMSNSDLQGAVEAFVKENNYDSTDSDRILDEIRNKKANNTKKYSNGRMEKTYNSKK